VPWNPSRLEQRNGRIDRKLQPAPVVYCHYFVYKQRPEDRVLQVLVRKTETIKKELGSLSQVLESRLADTLKMGIRHRDVDRLEREIDQADLDPKNKRTVEEELEEARERQDELRTQVDRLRNQLEESKKSIGLEEDHFRAALSSALELMGAGPLKPMPDSSDWEGGLTRYKFPALDQRAGADPTWAETMDTLRAFRKKEQRFWEWRRESIIRPVIFDDPGTMDETVVHLHLEHRVVQRLLGRFLAQGFVHHDLSRVCFTHTRDPIPRVVLIGRLCLYGPGAARLHEELVPVAARWTEPSRRKGPLEPYALEAESRTMNILEETLLQTNGRKASQTVLERLRGCVSQDVTELLPHLESRGRHLEKVARAKLVKRGEKEAQEMREVLEGQRRRIEATKKQYDDDRQVSFDFLAEYLPEEKKQLEANRRHWEKRLVAIDSELAREPERIRELYTVKASRLEPVGLVYLWPTSG